MDTDKLTPMMRQYTEHKQRHPDAILLFRMGDFYEMFFEDAKRASRILEIALTTRDKHKDEAVPMCGFPHHAASGYISRLLAAGEKVAVCDQMEDPRKAKGIVRRDVTRVLTPGLTEEDGTLKADENHFVVALVPKGIDLGLAAFDLSTGELLATQTSDCALAGQEIRRLDPKEVLLPKDLPDDHPMAGLLDGSFYLNRLDPWMYDARSAVDVLKDQFGVRSLDCFGMPEDSPITLSLGAMVNYVRQTRPDIPSHIRPPRVYHLGNYMVLDESTRRNLEIFTNIKDGTSKGALIRLIDRTRTQMGARLLRHWVSYPLLDVDVILRRSETVEDLVKNPVVRSELREQLKELGDLERIAGKISLKSATPRDLVQLRRSAEAIPELIRLLQGLSSPLSLELAGMDDLSYVAHAVSAVIVDSPPPGLKDGGVILDGYSPELDELRGISLHGKEWIAAIEAKERELTGIARLKVGYNRVFGYYIELTRTHQDKVPDRYIRKQTLVNAERYVTEELKEYELKVLNAQERIVELEAEVFALLRTRLLEVIPRIQETARSIAVLDVLVSFAELAASRGYVRPEVHIGDEILIREGRHPVVETFDHQEPYVPNDVELNNDANQILIITGPNMAGKSTYMRQVALIVLLAQMGSFVPAKEARIGVVDRIFTRIGAADHLAFGQSTFMVEMNETAEILHNASDRSLVLLDEVGRGTSTFDGLSIAWAVTEHLHDKLGWGPRTLFATHYHELVDLAKTKKRIRNFNVSVKEWKDKIVFLRKIVPGGASRSYGIQVARLAGIPDRVIERASEVLANLEKDELDPQGRPRISARNARRSAKSKAGQAPDSLQSQGELFPDPTAELLASLKSTDLNSTTPLDALNLLAAWKKKYS